MGLRELVTTYNAFIDAAVDYQQRQQNIQSTMLPTDWQANQVMIRNDSGYDLVKGSALGIGDPVIGPDDDLEAFKSRIVISGVLPSVEQHSGRFVVLAQPVRQDELGLAYIHGVCPGYINVVDETHRFVDVVASTPILQTQGGHGSEIIWKPAGVGYKWAILRLSRYLASSLLPVNLNQTGGAQGSNTTAASWTYDVTDVVSDSVLASSVNPVVSPHHWVRPSVGQMSMATFGYAHYDSSNQLVLGWINEMVVQTACTA